MQATSSYLNSAPRSFAEVASTRPPFLAGDKVISRQTPWLGSWIVVGCKPHPRQGFTVFLWSGPVEAIAAAEGYMRAPTDWVDPPVRPWPSDFRHLRDFGRWPELDLADRTFQRALADYRMAFADWTERHLVPLGFHDYAARARRVANLTDEDRQEAAE